VLLSKGLEYFKEEATRDFFCFLSARLFLAFLVLLIIFAGGTAACLVFWDRLALDSLTQRGTNIFSLSHEDSLVFITVAPWRI